MRQHIETKAVRQFTARELMYAAALRSQQEKIERSWDALESGTFTDAQLDKMMGKLMMRLPAAAMPRAGAKAEATAPEPVAARPIDDTERAKRSSAASRSRRRVVRLKRKLGLKHTDPLPPEHRNGNRNVHRNIQQQPA